MSAPAKPVADVDVMAWMRQGFLKLSRQEDHAPSCLSGSQRGPRFGYAHPGRQRVHSADRAGGQPHLCYLISRPTGDRQRVGG
jgi:hypothetical protein